jgi:hypothetical protein
MPFVDREGDVPVLCVSLFTATGFLCQPLGDALFQQTKHFLDIGERGRRVMVVGGRTLELSREGLAVLSEGPCALSVPPKTSMAARIPSEG